MTFRRAAPGAPATFCLVALGCPKARVEAETTLARLVRAGMRLVDDPAGADVAVVHTCGFVGEATRESLGVLDELAGLRSAGRLRRLVAVGCLPQRYGDAISRAVPGIDAWVGVNDLGRIVDAVRGRVRSLLRADPDPRELAAQPSLPSGRPHTRYLRVAEGCSRRCAFCAIPAIRGKARSRPLDAVVAEAEALADQGAVELVLVAQDLGRYGVDAPGERPGRPLLRLLERLARVDGVRWLRLLYLYPDAVSRRFLDGIAGIPKVAPYLDIPMQHSADRVLRLMRRGTSRRDLDALVDRVRTVLPDATLRSTFIVGHPGETESDFRDLVRFVRRSTIDRIGLFRYSDEEGTASFDMRDKVPPAVSYRRFRTLRAISRRLMRERQKALRGRVVEVLVDGPADETPLLATGRTAAQAPEIDGITYLLNGLPPAGSFVAARITRTSDSDLVADMGRL